MTYIIDLHRLWEGSSKAKIKGEQLPLKGFGRVSVVMVARGSFDLFRSLKQVMSQSFLREVIVVDLGLSPFLRHSLEQYTQQNTRCHIITGREQLGLAHAYNLGSHYCSGDYLFFMTEKALLPKNILARSLAFARHKTRPCVIGFGSDNTRHWIGKLMQFHAINTHILSEHKAFEPTSKVEGEGIFVSTRTFSLLKGMDEACFDEALAWDLSLRVHYAGGDVFQAKALPIEYQATAVSRRGMVNMRLQWQNYCGWRYFFNKYVSEKTHFLMKMAAHTVLLFQFMWDSLLSKSMSKPTLL